MDDRICINCAHAVVQVGNYYCKHPQAVALVRMASVTYRVTGKVSLLPCAVVRAGSLLDTHDEPGKCGPSGRLWEAKGEPVDQSGSMEEPAGASEFVSDETYSREYKWP